MSGALIESKMAGITAVVSDWHANSEVVKDNLEGIVLPETTAKALAQAVLALCKDTKKMQAMKESAYLSRYRYCTENYRQTMLNHVR